MKKCLAFLMFLSSLQVYSQLTASILIPPGGMVDKQQLWNILVTNTSTSPVNLRIQTVLTEVASGQPVLSATTVDLLIPAGTKQLSAASIGPIHYNTLSSNYRIDPGPTGLLPVGTFSACYDFLINQGKMVVQDCEQLIIQPLSPLLLNMPANGVTLEELHPTLSWLPLSSAQQLTNLSYTLKLVEVYPGQSAADAMEKNVPFFSLGNLTASQVFYAQNAPALQWQKQYAWQVSARNNLSEVTKSEVWTFSTKQNTSVALLPRPEPGYIKLKKAGTQDGYVVVWGNLRFDYLNESSDSVWKISVEDISSSQHAAFALSLDSVKLKRGQNLINYDATHDVRFVDKHHYLLQVVNSRNEVWQLRFEYRKPEQ